MGLKVATWGRKLVREDLILFEQAATKSLAAACPESGSRLPKTWQQLPKVGEPTP